MCIQVVQAISSIDFACTDDHTTLMGDESGRDLVDMLQHTETEVIVVLVKGLDNFEALQKAVRESLYGQMKGKTTCCICVNGTVYRNKTFIGKFVFELTKKSKMVFEKAKKKLEKHEKSTTETMQQDEPNVSFKKHSIFYKYLLYSKDLDNRLAIDVMHMEKCVRWYNQAIIGHTKCKFF
uniref:Uncharacterized protein n=1 Tax=Oryza brachyantha TaxID=4533 RepID=J3N0G4_ORYBR